MDFLALNFSKVFCLLVFFNFFLKCDPVKPETGVSKVNISVIEPTDSDENIAAIYIAIKKIELKGPDGWSTYKNYETPLQLNLLDSETSKSFFLGEKLLPAGQYMEARLVLEGNDKDNNDVIVTSGCYLQYKNGQIKPIYIPNKSKEGILAKGNFDLPAEGVVNITLHFDIREGLEKSMELGGHYLLKPQIKMVVNNDTGIIEGVFDEPTPYNKIVIFAYSSKSYSKAEFFSPAFQENRLAKSSSSSILNEEGKFVLSFLKTGKYDLYFYAYDEEGDFQSLIGKVDDIEIEGGQKTMVKVSREILID